MTKIAETIEPAQSTELAKIITDSGLELNDGEQIKQSYLPYFIELSEIKDEMKKINFDNPSELDETIAKKIRLKLVKIRTGSKDLKDQRKKIHLLRGNLEQDAWNLLKSTCELEEEICEQVEKRRENLEKARIEAVKQSRLSELLPLGFQFQNGFDLGKMDDAMYQSLRLGLETAKRDKEEAEAKAELERIEAEKARIAEDARIRADNERLQKERSEYEAKAKKEREALEKKMAEEKAKADAAKKEADAKLQAEREAREKLEREAKAKADAELKAKKDADAKIEAENKARLINEAKAAKAPLKEKMKVWVSQFSIPLGQPDCLGAVVIAEKFEAFKKWAESQIEEI